MESKKQPIMALSNMPSKLFGWNFKYLASFHGILNIFETVIAYASMSLIRDTCRPAYSSSSGGFVGSAEETYFYLSAFSCLMVTSMLLLSFVISQVSFMIMERTIVGVMFWICMCIMCLFTSLFLFIYVTYPNVLEVFGYTHKLTASILGFINCGLYAISSFKSYKACQNSWSYQFQISPLFP